MAKRICDPSPIKRSTGSKKGYRRSKAQIEQLQGDLYQITFEGRPCTVRNVFYRGVAKGIVDKTEHEYKAVGRNLVQMRRSGMMPYDWLCDNTRWRHKPTTHDDLSSMLYDQQQFYRRAIWRDQPKYIEVWLEKDSMVGTIFPETSKWDIPLLPCRGYPSLTFLAESAEEIREQNKPTTVFYCGDWDPSGVHISKKVEQELRAFCPEIDLTFQRLAINEEHIQMFDLPTRPTKASDSRSHSFKGESVELDAMDPRMLRRLVQRSIERLIDSEILERTRKVEKAEKETLDGIILRLEEGAA